MTSYTEYLDLAARMAAFPGRKNLICVGCLFAQTEDWNSFPTPTAAQVDRAVELRQVTEAFHDARVAVYPVGGQPPNGRVGAGNGAGAYRPGGLNPSPELISGLADATGGRSYTSGGYCGSHPAGHS